MTLRQELQISLRDEDYRHAYADEQLNLSIGTQIKVIREQQGLKQEQLAEKIGTKQAGVSRLESSNYAGWSIAGLRRLAQAFDLRLRVSFEEFGSLWEEVSQFSRETLQRRSFCNDPEFSAAPTEAERTHRRKRAHNVRGRRYVKRHSRQVHPTTSSPWLLNAIGSTESNNNSATLRTLSAQASSNSTATLPRGIYGN
jgi:transcriptional regulator with XRE-family HTH domain